MGYQERIDHRFPFPGPTRKSTSILLSKIANDALCAGKTSGAPLGTIMTAIAEAVSV
jgi:hypothetical protein